MSEPKADPKLRADLLRIWLPIAVVVLVGFAWAISSLEPPPPDRLRIATGSRDGAYHGFAERYREIMARDKVTLEIIETAGSGENLRLLHNNEADLALLQGGTASQVVAGKLESLASLFFEPVWIFYRKDLAVTRLAQLEGRRVTVGEEGSGARTLALRLLEASGLGPRNCELLELASGEAVRSLADGSADAGLFVASIEATYITELLADDSLDLLSFRRHRAYRRYFPFLSRVILGEGVLSLDENLPAQDVSLLATAASLAARPDLHDALIPLILNTMKEVHGSASVFGTAGQFPSTQYLELDISQQARHYVERGPSFLHRFLPFRVATLIDRTKILLLPFITLLIPFFRVAPPIYRWRIRSSIYRWYEDLREVEEALEGNSSLDAVRRHAERVKELEHEVSKEVSVPLSYMAEYYGLRHHIELVLARLRRLEAEAADGPADTKRSAATNGGS